MTKLIKRTYRITTDHDKIVKKKSKSLKKSESEVIRNSIELLEKTLLKETNNK